ncbi:MAG TPA: hypothetical protein VKX25_14280 [Bryobacteraceae bacterium]|jgi:hypothetical protein|nr:hypothetical protein [Bryobacteraceae bacterium]
MAALLGLLCVSTSRAFPQESNASRTVPVQLQVQAGTPLRTYLTRRVSYRVGETVQATLIEPVWAFDRVVIPAGATLQGKVVRLDPVSRFIRTRAIVGGDFTPLKHAAVSFLSVTFPDGKSVPLQTEDSLGLPTIYVPPRPPKKAKTSKPVSAQPSRVRQFLRKQVETQARNQANARSHGFYDFVRGPNKKEWLENYLFSKLPYHPQWYRTGTRFDAVLAQPLDFGTVPVSAGELANSRTPAPPNTIAQMRLLATISSSDAHVGDPMQGELSQPLFTPDHKLWLPQGTRFLGHITFVQRARLLHRGGKLRFTIDETQLPPGEPEFENSSTAAPESSPVQAQLVSAEADPKALKVDAEGTAKATESKTRLIRPVIAGLVAAKSLDNDTGKQTASGAGSSNTSGRALGGFSGFGIFGMAASRAAPSVGAALGFYGLAWSVYSNIISRGNEVTFEKNTSMAIQFGTPRTK